MNASHNSVRVAQEKQGKKESPLGLLQVFMKKPLGPTNDPGVL